jgi:hypothetical protein
MATGIIVPGRRLVTQPQYAAPLDKANKFRSRIKFAYSAGRGPHDGAHGLGSVTGTMTHGVGPKGRNIRPSDASSYLGFADNPDYNILGDITVIALVDIGGVSSQQGIITKCETSGGTNTPFGLFIETGGAISFNRANTGASAFRVWASSATVSSNTYVLAVTQVADMSVAPKFYINGVLDSGSPTSLYGGSGIGAATGNTTSVKIGNKTDLGAQFFGWLYEGSILSGVLAATEIAEYSRDLYAIWQAPTRRIWVAVSGGAAYTQSISGSLIPAGALTKQTSKPLSGSSTATGALTKQTGKALSGSSTPAGALSRLTSKAFAGSLTGTGQLIKQTAKAFAGSVTGSGALSTMILFTASIAGSITPTGALSKMTQKALAGASTLTGAITKLTNKGLSASITLSGALNKLTTKAFAGSVTVTGALAEAYQVVKSLAGSITPTGALATAYIAFVAGVLKMLSLMGVGQ